MLVDIANPSTASGGREAACFAQTPPIGKTQISGAGRSEIVPRAGAPLSAAWLVPRTIVDDVSRRCALRSIHALHGKKCSSSLQICGLGSTYRPKYVERGLDLNQAMSRQWHEQKQTFIVRAPIVGLMPSAEHIIRWCGNPTLSVPDAAPAIGASA